MAFQTLDELLGMVKNNPNRARDLVKKAEGSGTPVVSRNNPGYSNSGNSNNPRMAAMRRRMTAKKVVEDEEDQTKKMIKERKGLGY